jgi:hypothetical protein
MDQWFMQMILNSVGGVFLGIVVIPRLLSPPNGRYVALIGIWVLLCFLNFLFMLEKFGPLNSLFRSAIVAFIPFILGFCWTIVLKNSKSNKGS